MIAVDVLDSEKVSEDASIVHDDADFDEEDGSGLVGAGVTEEVQDIQKALKSSSLSSYIDFKAFTSCEDRRDSIFS